MGEYIVSYETTTGTKVDLNAAFIKKYLVRGKAELVTDQELIFFMNLCKVQKLNPLTGSEVYLIKYSNTEPAQVVVGKGTYLRRMFEHPDYLSKADGIVVARGKEIVHKEGTCMYPGEDLIGGWCRVHYVRGGGERSAYKEVSFSEYNKGQASWRSKPATMINKVAVSQCAREAFPKDYEGLYSEDEMLAAGAIPAPVAEIPAPVDKIPVSTATEEVESSSISASAEATQEEKQVFLDRISKRFETVDERNAAYVYVMGVLGLKGMSKMTVDQAEKAIEVLDGYEPKKDEQKEPETESVEVAE